MNRIDLDAGGVAEYRGPEVSWCPRAEGGHERGLLCLGQIDILLDRLRRRELRIHNEDELCADDMAHRSEVLLRVVCEFFVDARRNAELPDFTEQQRIAIRRSARDFL